MKTEAGALPERYVHHGITAGVASFTAKAMRSRYSRTIRHVEFPSTTMAIFAPSNLLIPDTFVGREQNVEPCGLSYFEQFAVRNPVPPALYRLCDVVA